MTDYSTEAQEVADALNAVYENKQTNKKNSISGDYSSDNESYPTVKAVKAAYGDKVTSWSSTVSDSNLPSEKLVKDSLDDKISKSSTSGLMKNDGTVMQSGTGASNFAVGNHTHSGYTVTVEKQSSAETGYAHTYVVKQGGSQVGAKINIPKDFLVKSGEVKTCTTANVPVQGYVVGDKYLDFVINSKDGGATDEHLYVLVSDMISGEYTADNSTLQLISGQFSIKNGGVGSDQIASAVKNSWLSTSDVTSEISAFASALAEAINPSS